MDKGTLASFQAAWEDNPGYTPSLAQVSAIPYASVLARIGDGPQGLLILATAVDDTYRWVDSEGVSIVTRRGRLIQIANHGAPEVSGYRSEKPDPLPEMTQRATATYTFQVDLPGIRRENVEVFAELSQQGLETVEFLTGPKTLWHITEKASAPSVGFSAVNHFWLDPDDGLVWQSVQHPVAGGGPVYLKLAKSFAGQR